MRRRLKTKRDITTHSTDTPKEMKHTHKEVRQVVSEELHEMHESGVPDCAIIYFYMHCERMDQTFIFSNLGPCMKI